MDPVRRPDRSGQTKRQAEKKWNRYIKLTGQIGRKPRTGPYPIPLDQRATVNNDHGGIDDGSTLNQLKCTSKNYLKIVSRGQTNLKSYVVDDIMTNVDADTDVGLTCNKPTLQPKLQPNFIKFNETSLADIYAAFVSTSGYTDMTSSKQTHLDFMVQSFKQEISQQTFQISKGPLSQSKEFIIFDSNVNQVKFNAAFSASSSASSFAQFSTQLMMGLTSHKVLELIRQLLSELEEFMFLKVNSKEIPSFLLQRSESTHSDLSSKRGLQLSPTHSDTFSGQTPVFSPQLNPHSKRIIHQVLLKFLQDPFAHQVLLKFGELMLFSRIEELHPSATFSVQAYQLLPQLKEQMFLEQLHVTSGLQTPQDLLLSILMASLAEVTSETDFNGQDGTTEIIKDYQNVFYDVSSYTSTCLLSVIFGDGNIGHQLLYTNGASSQLLINSAVICSLQSTPAIVQTFGCESLISLYPNVVSLLTRHHNNNISIDIDNDYDSYWKPYYKLFKPYKRIRRYRIRLYHSLINNRHSSPIEEHVDIQTNSIEAEYSGTISAPKMKEPNMDLEPIPSFDHVQIVIQQAQQQHEALNYGEMEYMLSDSVYLVQSPEDAACVSFGLGLACYEQKMYDESAEHFRETERKLKECYRIDSNPTHLNDISLCQVYLGEIECSQGHYRAAVEHFHTAVTTHQPNVPSTQEECYKLPKVTLSAKMSKFALALRCDNHVVDSEKYYRRALVCDDVTAADIISAQTSLGNLLHSVGSNDKAVTEYLLAIEKAEEAEDHLSLAWAHGNLGNTYLALGKKEQALHHLKVSLDLTHLHDPNPSSISRALNNLGTAYQSLSKLDDAETYYDEALSQAIYGNDEIGQARAYGNIGNVYMIQKDYQRAIPHYTEVLRLSKDKSTVYVAYHNRGCALFELAEERKGEQYYSLVRREFQFIAIGPDTEELEYKHQLPELEENTKELYQQALKDLMKVIKNVESGFSNSSTSTVGLDLYLSLFHINAKSFLRAQDCAFNLKEHYLALTIAEQARSRTLGELLLKRKTYQLSLPLQTPLTVDQIESIMELTDPFTPVIALSYTGTRLLGWVLVYDGRKVSINCFEQQPDKELFEGKSLDMYLRYELGEALTGNIELYGEESVSDEEVNEANNEEEDQLKKEETSNTTEEKSDKGTSNGRKRLLQVRFKTRILSTIHKMIIEPIQAVLKAVTPSASISHSKLILVPDNSTKMIPFPAVYDEENGSYFGDNYTLQFAPSLLTLGIMSQSTPTVISVPDRRKQVLIVGDPFTPPFQFKDEEWSLGPLPHARTEAQWVGHFMKSTPLIDEQPTKEIVKSLLPQAKLIHLATHGSATHGFVVLAGQRYNTQSTLLQSRHFVEDESRLLLYASEVESLHLQPCLVILSSCDSGRGVFKGDDIQGMSRAFFLAGAQAVMTSLWKVPDQSASYFMQYFYCYLLDGYSSSEALQKASLSIRSCLLFSQRIHWAGYQLTGQDVRVQVEVTLQDEQVWKQLGQPKGCSPFPRLDLLLQIEENLLSPEGSNVHVLWGPCGTGVTEPVIDFIAKHHSNFKTILWFNANHPKIIETTLKMTQSVLTDPVLVVVDDATVECLPYLTSLSSSSSRVQVILIAHSLVQYETMSREVDTLLQEHCNRMPHIVPLTDLQVTQRLVYSLMSQRCHFAPKQADQHSIDRLATICGGSPAICHLTQTLLNGLTRKNENLSVGVQEVEAEMRAFTNNYPLRKLNNTFLHTSAICSMLNVLSLSTASRCLLNSLASFNGVPFPQSVLKAIDNEVMSCSEEMTSSIKKLQEANIIIPYPSPVILSSSESDNGPLYFIPDAISEAVQAIMDRLDHIVAIRIASKSLANIINGVTSHKDSNRYLHGLVQQLRISYTWLEFPGTSGPSESESESMCYANLYSLEELLVVLDSQRIL